LSIRNAKTASYLHAGHCSRCDVPFVDEAIVTKDRVIWKIIGDLGLAAVQWAPFCEPCAGPDACAAAKREYVCGGCGILMRGPEAWKARTCSKRCEQRVRRAARRAMTQRVCSCCGNSFIGRADAKFCGSACRQKSYRHQHKRFPMVTGSTEKHL